MMCILQLLDSGIFSNIKAHQKISVKCVDEMEQQARAAYKSE